MGRDDGSIQSKPSQPFAGQRRLEKRDYVDHVEEKIPYGDSKGKEGLGVILVGKNPTQWCVQASVFWRFSPSTKKMQAGRAVFRIFGISVTFFLGGIWNY